VTQEEEIKYYKEQFKFDREYIHNLKLKIENLQNELKGTEKERDLAYEMLGRKVVQCRLGCRF
jgi:hypothetical protein